MRLRAKVVDLIGLHLLDNAPQPCTVSQISRMEKESRAWFMRIYIDVIDAIRIERRASAEDTVNFVALIQEQFGQIGTILSRYSCD